MLFIQANLLPLLFITCLVYSIYWKYGHISKSYAIKLKVHVEKVHKPVSTDPVASIKPGNRWIIVTSISYPTRDVKRLASFHNWNLVVVADTKTPIDWRLKSVHFLSIDYQKSLGFASISALPYKSYTRKNIGYLYAIFHGAEWIYDTDDDNKPYGLGLDQFSYEDEISGLRYIDNNGNISEKLFNPYRFYGLSNMWPRGFPLEYKTIHTNGKNRQILCSKMKRPAVQQGLVNHDPDVDAIYRLINADKNGLNEKFNKYVPSITLEPGTYAPWNSQNTLFHKSSFHILMLPTTVSFRTTDIWRSFYAQKILHLSGLTVSFTPANAVQFRNAHDFLKDFKDEEQVYVDAGRIVRFLDTWKCNETLIECMKILANDFVENKFWKMEDVTLIELYIQDLLGMGYKFPKIKKNGGIYKANNDEKQIEGVNCRRANFEFDLSYPKNSSQPAITRSQQKIDNFGTISNWCNESGYNEFANNFPTIDELANDHLNNEVINGHLSNVLLIVNNYPWELFPIGHLQRLYQPFFASTVFCGSYYPTDTENLSILEPFNYIHTNPAEIHKGYYAYHCLTLLYEVGMQNVGGYILLADDTHFNIWQKFDLNKVFHLTGVNHLNESDWWHNGNIGLVASKKIVNEMKNTSDKKKLKTWRKFEKGLKKYGYIGQNQTAYDDLLSGKSRSVSDFFYVPSSEMEYYSNLMRIFYKSRLFLELAVNRFLRSVDYNKSKYASAQYLWNMDRSKWDKVYNSSMIALHPIKLSMFNSPDENRYRYCSKILKVWHDVIFNNADNYTMSGIGEIKRL